MIGRHNAGEVAEILHLTHRHDGKRGQKGGRRIERGERDRDRERHRDASGFTQISKSQPRAGTEHV